MIITAERFFKAYSWDQYLGRIRPNRDLFQKSFDPSSRLGRLVCLKAAFGFEEDLQQFLFLSGLGGGA